MVPVWVASDKREVTFFSLLLSTAKFESTKGGTSLTRLIFADQSAVLGC